MLAGVWPTLVFLVAANMSSLWQPAWQPRHRHTRSNNNLLDLKQPTLLPVPNVACANGATASFIRQLIDIHNRAALDSTAAFNTFTKLTMQLGQNHVPLLQYQNRTYHSTKQQHDFEQTPLPHLPRISLPAQQLLALEVPALQIRFIT